MDATHDVNPAAAPSSLLAPYELDSPYLNAPVWPWFAAGSTLATLFILLFLLAWSLA